MKNRVWQNALLLAVAASLTLTSVLRPSVTLEPPWIALFVSSLVALFAGFSLPFLNVARQAGSSVFVLTCFLACFFAAPLIGGSLDIYRTQVTQLNWVGFGGIFLAILIGVRSARQWRAMAWWFLGLTTALTLYGLQKYRGEGQERLLSTFVNADCFSLYPLVAIFLGLGLFYRASPQARLFLHANTILQLLALLLTGARATLIGLVVAVVVQCLLLARRKAKKGSHPVVQTMAPLGMAFFLLLLSSFFLLPGMQRWQRLLEGGETQGIAMRRDVLLRGGRAALSTPLFGTGPGTFALRYQEVRPISEVRDRIHVNVAHNDYVELAVESGLPLLMLWLLLGLTVFERAISAMRRNPLAYEYSGAAAALAGITAYQFLNFAIPVPANLHLIALLLGLTACSIEDPPQETVNPRARQFFLVAALLIFVLGSWAALVSFKGQRGYRLALSAEIALAELRLEDAEAAYEKALQGLPHRAKWWLGLAETRGLRAELEPDPKQGAQVLAALERAYRASPRDFAVASAWARGLGEAKRTDEALQVLQEAIRLNDYYNPLRKELVTLYLRQGKILEATELQLQLYSRDQETLKRAASLLAAAEIAVPEATEKLLAKVPIALEPLEPLIKETSTRLVSMKRYAEADRISKVWGQLKGEDSCFWLERSDIWAQAKNAEMELKCLERAVEDRNLSSNCFESALLRYAKVATANGKGKIAEARLTAYVDRGSAGSIAYAALAQLQLDKGQREHCRRLVIAGLEQYPRDPHLLVVRGNLSLKEGFFESAREDAQDVIEMDPKNTEAKVLLQKVRGGQVL